jgi:ribonucleoside-diphosphate reductase beta chain
MASFAVTFSICSTGLFQPIGKAVQKICQDELEVHSEYRKEMIKELISDELGKAVFEKRWMDFCTVLRYGTVASNLL